MRPRDGDAGFTHDESRSHAATGAAASGCSVCRFRYAPADSLSPIASRNAASSSAVRPLACISTRPSARFRTQPMTSKPFAICLTDQRKPTPCTCTRCRKPVAKSSASSRKIVAERALARRVCPTRPLLRRRRLGALDGGSRRRGDRIGKRLRRRRNSVCDWMSKFSRCLGRGCAAGFNAASKVGGAGLMSSLAT